MRTYFWIYLLPVFSLLGPSLAIASETPDCSIGNTFIEMATINNFIDDQNFDFDFFQARVKSYLEVAVCVRAGSREEGLQFIEPFDKKNLNLVFNSTIPTSDESDFLEGSLDTTYKQLENELIVDFDSFSLGSFKIEKLTELNNESQKWNYTDLAIQVSNAIYEHIFGFSPQFENEIVFVKEIFKSIEANTSDLNSEREPIKNRSERSLYRSTLSAENPLVLNEDKDVSRSIEISYDHHFLSYVNTSSVKGKLYAYKIISLDTDQIVHTYSPPKNLTLTKALSFPPDCEKFVFSAGTEDEYQLYSYEHLMRSTKPIFIELDSEFTKFMSPKIAWDGEIYFTGDQDGLTSDSKNALIGQRNKSESTKRIFKVAPSLGSYGMPQQISSSYFNYTTPQISPEKDWISYFQMYSGGIVIVIVHNTLTGEKYRIANFKNTDSLHWRNKDSLMLSLTTDKNTTSPFVLIRKDGKSYFKIKGFEGAKSSLSISKGKEKICQFPQS